MSRPARILFVIPALAQGGAERQILELARRLDPNEFEPVLCTFDDDPHYASLVPPGMRQTTLGVRAHGVWRGFRRLLAVIRAERPALVQSFMDRANLWCRLAAPLVDVPMVTSVRTPRIRWSYLFWESVLAPGDANPIVVNSRSTSDEIFRRSTVGPSRVHVVHNFIDCDAFRPATAEQRRAARARFGLGEGETVLLLSGRVALQKNQAGLAVALGRLRARGLLPPEVRVLVAGRVKERWYAPVAARAFRMAGVGEQLVPVGVVPAGEVTQLYAAADVLLLPSLFEGLPNVALEAHACGLPAVVSDPANVDGIVAHGETGQVAPVDATMSAYTDALAHMLALPAPARAEMGRRGRERVRTLFDPAQMLERWLRLYRAVLGARVTPPAR